MTQPIVGNTNNGIEFGAKFEGRVAKGDGIGSKIITADQAVAGG